MRHFLLTLTQAREALGRGLRGDEIHNVMAFVANEAIGRNHWIKELGFRHADGGASL